MATFRWVKIIFAGTLAALAAGCSSVGDNASLKVGAAIPLTGREAALGRSMQHGLELAAADVNAAGGVNGQPITLSLRDSQGDTSEGGAVEYESDHGANVLLVGDAALAIAMNDKLSHYPQLIGFMCDYVPALVMAPKNGVRIYLNGDQEAKAIEGYAAASGLEKASVIFQNIPTGQSHSRYLDYLLQADHFGTYLDSYSPGEKDFQLLAKAMLRIQYGALIMVGDGPEYPDILAAFDATGWKGLAFGYVPTGNLTALNRPGGLAATAMYPLPDFAINPRSTEAGRTFADKFRAKYGEDPDLPAAYAYDNICALAAASAQAKSFDPAKIREAFIALTTYTGATGRYNIKGDGDTEMPMRLYYANGQPAPPPVKSTVVPNMTNVPSSNAPVAPSIDSLYAPPPSQKP
jgi:branched-chain amino acid transport system substrate-binding protein